MKTIDDVTQQQIQGGVQMTKPNLSMYLFPKQKQLTVLDFDPDWGWKGEGPGGMDFPLG